MGFGSHTIKRADGSERRLLGYKHVAPPEGAAEYATDSYADGALPPKVDLRPFMTAVENQGQLNSCVANAVAGAYEYLVKRHLSDDAYDVSRLFVYYNARAASGMETADEGSAIGDAIDSLKQQGACSEGTWQYDEGLVNESPSEQAYEEAKAFLVESSELVDTDLFVWKHALAEGYPIIFGCLLFNSFDSGRKGKIPMPTPREAGREEHGGHAMLCVGYSDHDRVFIVRNSWGESWGDNGYCYMPYDYLMNGDYNSGDSWIIRRLDKFDPNVAWGTDEGSILPTLETALGTMSDEDFTALLDGMGDWPLEFRLGLILLNAAAADGEATEEELAGIGEYLGKTLAVIGVDSQIDKLLQACIQELDNEELLNESVALLGEYLPNEVLASITNDAIALAGASELTEDEAAFAESLAGAWQLQLE